jgi:hypothetical protein
MVFFLVVFLCFLLAFNSCFSFLLVSFFLSFSVIFISSSEEIELLVSPEEGSYSEKIGSFVLL